MSREDISILHMISCLINLLGRTCKVRKKTNLLKKIFTKQFHTHYEHIQTDFFALCKLALQETYLLTRNTVSRKV